MDDNDTQPTAARVSEAFDEFCNWRALTGWGPLLRDALGGSRDVAAGLDDSAIGRLRAESTVLASVVDALEDPSRPEESPVDAVRRLRADVKRLAAELARARSYLGLSEISSLDHRG